MSEYINLDAAYDETTLRDWYISSTDGEPPIWTEEHIAELLRDFYVIPKGNELIDDEAKLKWFKVSECLPDAQQDVLLCFDGCLNMVVGGRYTSKENTPWYANTGGEFYTDCYNPNTDVGKIQPPTHWMPLPEPPDRAKEELV